MVADDTCFELAATTDGGENPLTTPEKIAEPLSREQLENEPGFSGGTWLEFVDEQHGWQLLTVTTNSANLSNGEMLRTADGGKTWTPTKETPTANHCHFINAKDGWIASSDEQIFYVTHDGGDSWRPVSLPVVSATTPNYRISYDLPLFVDERHGYMFVRYLVETTATSDLTTSVLFETADGGRTWKEEKTVARQPEQYFLDSAGSLLVINVKDQSVATKRGTASRPLLVTME